ncbi:MAG: hypothetical protein ACRDZ3_20605 [Acidimicrobiia bacterium]
MTLADDTGTHLGGGTAAVPPEGSELTITIAVNPPAEQVSAIAITIG